MAQNKGMACWSVLKGDFLTRMMSKLKSEEKHSYSEGNSTVCAGSRNLAEKDMWSAIDSSGSWEQLTWRLCQKKIERLAEKWGGWKWPSEMPGITRACEICVPHTVTTASGNAVSELVGTQVSGHTFPRKPSFTAPGLLDISKGGHVIYNLPKMLRFLAKFRQVSFVRVISIALAYNLSSPSRKIFTNGV